MHTTWCHHVPRTLLPLRWQAPAAAPCTRAKYGHRRAVQLCQASRCHYDVLGLQPTASADEIKSAFRKLALQLHPDVNTAPNATEKFKSVKDAYEVLSDPQQRAAYNSQRLQAQTSYTRSSRYTRSSSGASGAEYVVYDYTDVDETFEEAASAGFWGWYQQSGSWQSSWRSNRKKRKQQWQQQQQQQAQAQQQAKQQASRQQQQTKQQAARQAQERQARQRQQAQERQRQRYRHQQQYATVGQLLSQLDAASLKLVRSLFGQEMERLDSLEDLVDVLESLEMLKRQGIDLGEAIFGDPSLWQPISPSSSSNQHSSSSNAWNARASASTGGSKDASSSASASSWGGGTAKSSSSSRAGGGRASSSAYSSSRGASSSSSSSSMGASSSSSSGRAGSRASSAAYSSNVGSNSSSRRSAAGARSSKGPWVGSSRQNSKHLPRFDELSADELYELINSKTDRKAAKAARAWVQEMLAANRMHPSVAGNLAFLLATEYIMGDIPDPRDFVFGEMFDPDSERYKGRARAGSAYDYVRYSSSDCSSDDDDDDSDGWVDVDELLSVVDVWSLGDDSDESDDDL